MPKIFCHKCFSMLNSILKRVCFLKFLYLWVPYFAKFHSSLWSLWPSKIRATELDLTSALMFSTVVNTFLSININKARRCFVRKTFCQDCLRRLSGPFYATFFSAGPAWTLCQEDVLSGPHYWCEYGWFWGGFRVVIGGYGVVYGWLLVGSGWLCVVMTPWPPGTK